MEKDLYSYKEEIPDNGPIRVTYERPKFFHRIMANFIDILLFFGVLILLFIPTNAIVRNTPQYLAAEKVVNTRINDSGIYTYYDKTKTYLTWPSYYDNYSEDSSGYVKATKCSEAIDNFIEYVKTNAGEEKALEVQNAYDEFRLSKTFEDEPYFIKNSENIIVSNKESDGGTCKASSDDYYKNIYKPYIMSDCAGYLITIFSDYYYANKTMSNFFFYLEAPVVFVLSVILVYYVPPLFFRRGRKTLGKALFRIGLVDSRILSPSFGRFTARFGILFAEFILSVFTFMIPFIISFSLMVFSKEKQGFPDYMLKLNEVDTNKARIYYSKYEALLETKDPTKKPVDFKPINKE